MPDDVVTESEQVCLPINEDESLTVFIDGEECSVGQMFELLLQHGYIPKVLMSMKNQLRAFGHDVQITRSADENLCKKGWQKRAVKGM